MTRGELVAAAERIRGMELNERRAKCGKLLGFALILDRAAAEGGDLAMLDQAATALRALVCLIEGGVQ